MENNTTLQELNKTKSLYTKHILNSALVNIFFTAANVNIFVFIFWTLIYYALYYGYMVNKMNKNADTINQSNEENENMGSPVNKNITLVETYQKILPRIIPFFIFILVLILLQYVFNVFIMRNKCGQDSFISFRTVNIYTIGVWFILMLLAFVVLYKVPKLKAIYSKTVEIDLFNSFVQPSRENIFKSLFKKAEQVTNPDLKQLIKNINCDLMKKTTKKELGDEEFKTHCQDKKPVFFLSNINISNYHEYFKLMEPIMNRKGQENEFLKYIIKKDIICEMLWIIQIGLLVIVFIYTKLNNTDCLNHKKTHEQNVKAFVDSKMKQCNVPEEQEQEQE